MAQPAVYQLLDCLVDRGHEVSLETSGSMPINEVSPKVSRVVDIKPPGSGEMESNLYDNILALTRHDQVKFVMQDEEDYRWAVMIMEDYRIGERCEVLFSPVAGSLSPEWLADQIVRDRLNVRFQLQLHKILWGDRQGV